jgi:hypothetical protein
MGGGAGAVYCDDVTSPAAAAGRAAISALWAPASWRATVLALTGLLIQVGTGALLGLWILDLWTLADGPGSDETLNAFYVLVAVAGPVPLLWWLGSLSAVQRFRFAAVLDVDIPTPPRPAGRWPRRLARAARTPGGWRHLGYHLLSIVIGLGGGGAVAACWAAPLIAASYPGGLPVGPGAWPPVMSGRPRRCWARARPSGWSSGWRRWPAAGPRSSPRPTPSAGASSGTCTTVRSSS